MGLSTTREATSCAAIQHPRILWNLKFHYRAHVSSPFAPILSQTNLVNTSSSDLSKINVNIIVPPISWSS
jgi:hypothetical protein